MNNKEIASKQVQIIEKDLVALKERRATIAAELIKARQRETVARDVVITDSSPEALAELHTASREAESLAGVDAEIQRRLELLSQHLESARLKADIDTKLAEIESKADQWQQDRVAALQLGAEIAVALAKLPAFSAAQSALYSSAAAIENAIDVQGLYESASQIKSMATLSSNAARFEALIPEVLGSIETSSHEEDQAVLDSFREEERRAGIRSNAALKSQLLSPAQVWQQ